MKGGKGEGRTFMFFLCEHEDGEDKFGSENRFDENSLRETRALTQRRAYVEVGREED